MTDQEILCREAFKMYMKNWRSKLTDEQKAEQIKKQRERYQKNKEAHKAYRQKYIEKMGGKEEYNKLMREYAFKRMQQKNKLCDS